MPVGFGKSAFGFRAQIGGAAACGFGVADRVEQSATLGRDRRGQRLCGGKLGAELVNAPAEFVDLLGGRVAAILPPLAFICDAGKTQRARFAVALQAVEGRAGFLVRDPCRDSILARVGHALHQCVAVAEFGQTVARLLSCFAGRVARTRQAVNLRFQGCQPRNAFRRGTRRLGGDVLGFDQALLDLAVVPFG